MALIIEDQALDAAHMTAEELRLEIGILLYQLGKYSLGQASQFLGIHKVAFQKELAQREIAMNYDAEEFEKDLETLGIVQDDSSK